IDDILDKWKAAPAEKIVWGQFTDFLKKYNNNQKTFSKFSAPIACGSNIIKYDNIITQRLCQKYGYADKENKPKIFAPRDNIDLLNLFFLWFENLAEPTEYNLDYLRDFFGYPKDNAHDALDDVKFCGILISKFLKLHRKFSSGIKFKGALTC